jgi:hypothetical protein
MVTRLARRAEGDIPIQCPITFMKRTTNLWSRFVDRHYILTSLVMLAGLVGIIAEGVRALH